MWLVVAGLLAGCSSPAQDVEPEAPPVLPAQGLPDLPCEPSRSTVGLSPSLEVLAVETFGDDGGFREEIDTTVRDGRPLLAVSQPNGDALEFLDVGDPRAPRLLATWYGDEGGYLDDFKFLPDGSGIVTVGRTLRLLDARVLEDVRVEADLALDGGPAGAYGHTVQVWTLDGGTYVSMAKAEGGDLSIFRLDGAPGARTIQRLAHFGATPVSALPGRPDPIRSHDTWFEVDPQSGVPLLWVANVHWGVIAYDVSDPSNPAVASTMPPAADNPVVGYMHTAQVAHLPDGRRLVVGAQEFETGVLKVWDATDLAAPRYIGYYHTPVPTYAFHNMQVVGQYVFAAHFNDGLFVFDLAELPTTSGQAAFMQVFAHAPAEGVTGEEVRNPVSRAGTYDGTLEVVVRDGILWTTEVDAGVRSLAFGCLEPGDARATSTG